MTGCCRSPGQSGQKERKNNIVWRLDGAPFPNAGLQKELRREQRRTPVIDGLLQLEEVFRVRQKVELRDHFYKTFLRLWRLPPTFNSWYFCTTKQRPQSSVRVDRYVVV